MCRPLLLEFPEDAVARRLNDQFLLGEEILVAPIFREGHVERNVYLPKGYWIHLWTGKEYSVQEGYYILEKAPLGQIPVYYTKGGLAATLLEGIANIDPVLMNWGMKQMNQNPIYKFVDYF